MPVQKDKISAARRASDLSLERAAEVVELSKQGYINREKDPDQFRLCELERLYDALTETAKPILREAVTDIFLP